MKIFLTEFHYKKEYKSFREVVQSVLLYSVLFVPSCCYFVVSSARNFLYKKNVLKSYKPKAYTISVGNLTTGGTGKTPITAEIANYLTKKGERPAILSRGYGGKLRNKDVNVISDGKDVFYSAIDAGDEPYWLATNCQGTAVLTCSSRIKAAKYAQEKLYSNRLILDDGFQHQKMKRDLNILVVDSQKQFSNGFVLPLGALREPLVEIKRADKVIVVNKRFNDKSAKAYARYLRKKYNKPCFVCSMVPDKVYNIKTGELISDNTPVVAFSAIGQPEQFYSLLRGYDVMATRDFADHHLYTRDDISELIDLKDSNSAQALITTEKDAVKLQEIIDNDMQIYALRLKPSLDLQSILNE